MVVRQSDELVILQSCRSHCAYTLDIVEAGHNELASDVHYL